MPTFNISARNQIAGTVTNITIDGVSAEVTAVITRGPLNGSGFGKACRRWP